MRSIKKGGRRNFDIGRNFVLALSESAKPPFASQYVCRAFDQICLESFWSILMCPNFEVSRMSRLLRVKVLVPIESSLVQTFESFHITAPSPHPRPTTYILAVLIFGTPPPSQKKTTKTTRFHLRRPCSSGHSTQRDRKLFL